MVESSEELKQAWIKAWVSYGFGDYEAASRRFKVWLQRFSLERKRQFPHWSARMQANCEQLMAEIERHLKPARRSSPQAEQQKLNSAFWAGRHLMVMLSRQDRTMEGTVPIVKSLPTPVVAPVRAPSRASAASPAPAPKAAPKPTETRPRPVVSAAPPSPTSAGPTVPEAAPKPAEPPIEVASAPPPAVTPPVPAPSEAVVAAPIPPSPAPESQPEEVNLDLEEDLGDISLDDLDLSELEGEDLDLGDLDLDDASLEGLDLEGLDLEGLEGLEGLEDLDGIELDDSDLENTV